MFLTCFSTVCSVTTNCLVGPALGHQREDFALAVGESIERAVALPGPTDELGDDCRIDRAASAHLGSLNSRIAGVLGGTASR
jgi:hypothetical protein